MIEKQNEALKKKDLDVILEVNKKSIEIETEVAEQNEEIIDALNRVQGNQDTIIKKFDRITELINEVDKEQFRIRILFLSGFVSIILALIGVIAQIFLKK